LPGERGAPRGSRLSTGPGPSTSTTSNTNFTRQRQRLCPFGGLTHADTLTRVDAELLARLPAHRFWAQTPSAWW
jgi:hypothetical protein